MIDVLTKIMVLNSGYIDNGTEYKEFVDWAVPFDDGITLIGANLQCNTEDFPATSNRINRATATAVLTLANDDGNPLWYGEGQLLCAFQEREIETPTNKVEISKINDAVPWAHFMLPAGYGIHLNKWDSIFLGLHYQNQTNKPNSAGCWTHIFYTRP